MCECGARSCIHRGTRPSGYSMIDAGRSARAVALLEAYVGRADTAARRETGKTPGSSGRDRHGKLAVASAGIAERKRRHARLE